ncbi:MAG: hypothetical protein AB7S26_31355 [Sandaracinaceae bacterium]
MSQNENSAEPDYADLAIAVYLEELATSKRVLYLGGLSPAGAERLARVADRVDYVAASARARGTARNGVTSRGWPTAADEGSWDLIVVPSLGRAGLAHQEKLSSASRWLARGGVMVAGTEASGDDAVGYERFFELLADAFDSVCMVGQAPFAGYSLVQFAPDGEIDVTFDGSLLVEGGESAERYLAVCAEADVSLDGYAVVQVPSWADQRAPKDSGARSDELDAIAERLREREDELGTAQRRCAELEGDLSSARERLGRIEADADRSRREQATLRERIAGLERELGDASRGGSSDDGEYRRLEEALAECGHELTAAKAELGRRATLVRDLVEELREARTAPPIEVPVSVEAVPTSARPLDALAMTDPPPTATDADAAVARAVRAEAEKAALSFQLDEVRGELVLAQQRASHDAEDLRRMEAALRGTVRGLNARLAEVTELYQQTQARLALVEEDRRGSEDRVQELTRQLSMLRERLEFEIARAHARDAEERERDDVEASDAATADTLPLTEVSQIVETASALAAARAADDGGERIAAEREGLLLGQLVKAREEASDLAIAVREARIETDAARAEVERLEAALADATSSNRAAASEHTAELERLSAEAERARIAEGELRARLEAAQHREQSLSGELSGVKLRLADREAAVAALSAASDAASDARQSEANHEVERARLRAEVGQLREELTEARSLIPPPAAEPPAPEPPAAEPSSAAVEPAAVEPAAVEPPLAEPPAPLANEELEARARELDARLAAATSLAHAQSALVARLQSQLQSSVAAQRDAERDLEQQVAAIDEHAEAVASARIAADVQVGQSSRELEELTAQLDASETERRRAVAALEDSRAILGKLLKELPRGASAPGSTDKNAEYRALRDRLAQRDAEAADRELLLRSLTAQLEERDDRLRALSRLGANASGDDDPQALRARLFEMEERVARLSEELDHARRRLEQV